MSLYQKYNAKKREKRNIFLYRHFRHLLRGKELALGSCSGELLWGGVTLEKNIALGQMLLWGGNSEQVFNC